MFRSLFLGIQDLVYPPYCILCHSKRLTQRPFSGICPECIQSLPLDPRPRCIKCSRPLLGDYPGRLCRNCVDLRPAFDCAYGGYLFSDEIRHLLHQFKFYQRTYLRHAFVKMMLRYINYYNIDIDQYDAFIPMPLANSRLRERGYNQSLLLAQLLALHYDKPLWCKTLVKYRATPPQSDLGRKERFTNVRGAFRIKPSKGFSGSNILIIDDLLTTGATANAAALTAKKAGAGKVAILTLAIAGGDPIQ